jgi:hypothetical protein
MFMGDNKHASILFVLATLAGAQAVLVLAILCWRGDELGKPGSYARRNWRTFGVSALVAFALVLLFSRPILENQIVRDGLTTHNSAALWGVWLLLISVLIAASGITINFWARFRRTWAFEVPPLQYLHVAVICSLFGALGALFSRFPETSTEVRTLIGASAISVASWVTATCIASRRRAKTEGVFDQARPGFSFFPDDPISDELQDCLHRAEFTDELHRLIVTLPFKESFVISLNAPWGFGKTSTLRWLSKKFKSDSNVVLMEFDPWYFPTEEALIVGFYDAVERTLNANYLTYNLKGQLQRLAGSLSVDPKSWHLGFRFRPPADPERLREQVEAFIQQAGKQFIVLVDDIDRLHSKEILALFKLVRLSARFRNTVFLLSFDTEVVVRALEEESLDRDFLDKIVQMQVNLPPPAEQDIERFLWFSSLGPTPSRCAIDRLLDALNVSADRRKRFDDLIVPLTGTSFSHLFRTIRQAKRFINAVAATLPSVVDEVDLFDFCLISALRIFFPSVYQDVWENRYSYVNPPESRIMKTISFSFERDNYRKEAKQRTENLLAREVSHPEDRQIALDILKNLFSSIKLAFDGFLVGNRSEEKGRTHKRIDSPDCFERYFLLREDADEIPDREVEAMIRDWNAAELASARRKVTLSFDDALEQGRLSSLLRKLQTFVLDVNPICVRAVLLSIASSVSAFSRTTGNLRTDYDHAEALVLRLIDRVAEQGQMQELFLATLDAIDDEHLHFAVGLVHSCEPGRSSLDRIPTHCDIGRLREKVAARLRDFYVTRGGDLFSLPDRDWIFILAQWGIYFELSDAKVDVQSLVVRKLEQSPGYLGRLLKGFFGTTDFGNESYSNFSKLCDPDLVVRLADRNGNSALTDEFSRAVMKRFRELHSSSKSAS